MTGDEAWDQLVALRRESVKQGTVARRMDRTQAAVSLLESNKRGRDSLTTLAAYAEALGFDVDIQLISRTENNTGGTP